MLASNATARFDERRIDKILAGLDNGQHPGAAVGIAVAGKPVYRKGFGLASVELPVRLSATMRMRIGSTTKHFTALAYMLLCEDGKARLDDPISRFIPEIHPISGNVTMRSLISHTSGLRDVFDMILLFCGAGRTVAADQYSDLYQTIDHINASPGHTWSYNNGGYILLTHAIERITGEPLETFLRRRIFEPVGMADTLLRRRDTDFVSNSATLHTLDKSGAYARDYMGMDLGGEGGLVSTVDDMLRWLSHMDAPTIGSPETWAAMVDPVRLNSGASSDYGLGLMLHRYRGVATIAHAGTVFGGNSQMIKVPSAGLDIAIMVNRPDVSAIAIAEAIIDTVVPNLDPVAVQRPDPPISGAFVTGETGTVLQFRLLGTTEAVCVNGTESPTRKGGDYAIYPVAPGMQGTFVTLPPAEGEDALIYSTHGAWERGARLPRPDSATTSGIDGRYGLNTPLIDIEIDDDGRKLRSIGPFGSTDFALERLSPDIWQMRSTGNHPIGAVITFTEDRGRFLLSTGRNIKLPFERKR